MSTVLLVIHIMIAAALVFIVLIQKSEGGALGIGGAGGLFAGRGKANLMTRVTAALAAAFFTTSLLLTILSQRGGEGRSILDLPSKITTPPKESNPSDSSSQTESTPPRGGILDKLR